MNSARAGLLLSASHSTLREATCHFFSSSPHACSPNNKIVLCIFVMRYINLIHKMTPYFTQNFHAPLKHLSSFYMHDTEEMMRDISTAGKPKEYWCNVMQ